ncbi:MAG: 1-acyl-sn-glycerol-3-phosphate acyltransferase [Deltaproteobacteria bacterium]|nr:1-acyl-sn-glycerol-3-phosphate acyltransferase [Deltaproteobacteria bacterium]
MKTPLLRWPRIVVAALAMTVMSLVMVPIFVVAALLTSSGSPTYRMSLAWAWVVAKILGVSYSLRNGEKATPGQSYIVVPNHQSHTDILALLLTLPVRYRWVIKKELVKIPVFGWGLALTGAIVLDRSNPEQARQKLQDGSSKAAGGWSILIYPEGTRSPDGKLLPFKKGPFMLAVSTGVPLLPVTVNGAYKILPKKTLELRPGHITVTLSDPISTEGLDKKDVPELLRKTKAAIEANLDPHYDPFASRNGTPQAKA